MKPLFSEFTYGYALTEQFVYRNCSNMKVAPVFPSLYQEGKNGCGYDVRLERGNTPMFFQFKLSDYMLGRSNCVEIKKRLFTGFFYRMHLRSQKYSKQHHLLLELQNLTEHVYYVAPLFHEIEKLNKYYLNKQIIENSAFITPRSIGIIKDINDHHISFQELGKPFYVCSEPRELDILSSFEDFVEHIRERLDYSETNWEFITRNMLEILQSYQVISSQDRESLTEMISNREPIQQVEYLARTFFDSQLLIVSRL